MGLTLVREDRVGRTSSAPVVAAPAAPGSCAREVRRFRGCAPEDARGNRRVTCDSVKLPFAGYSGAQLVIWLLGRFEKSND